MTLRREGGASQTHSEEEKLIGGVTAPKLISTDASIEDPLSFALEEHLEDFLVRNWPHTALGKDYDIYEEDGEQAQQYQTDTGPLDILAVSKDKLRPAGIGGEQPDGAGRNHRA